MNDKIAKLEEQALEKDKFIRKLLKENEKYKEVTEKIAKITHQNKYIQTDQKILINEGTQTKKHKTKAQMIQTENQEEKEIFFEKSRTKSNKKVHSKSF